MAYITLWQKKGCITAKQVVDHLPEVMNTVKTRIPSAATQAFTQKTSKPTGKTFDFLFEMDHDAGKCRLKVKGLGSDWVHEWVDEARSAAKREVEAASKELEELFAALPAFENKIHPIKLLLANELPKRVKFAEEQPAQRNFNPGAFDKLVSEARKSLDKAKDQCADICADYQHWRQAKLGPGLPAFLKKHHLTEDDLGETIKRTFVSTFANMMHPKHDALDAQSEVVKAAGQLVVRLDTLEAKVAKERKETEEKLKQLRKELDDYRKSDTIELQYDKSISRLADFLKKGESYKSLKRNLALMPQIILHNRTLLQERSKLMGRFLGEYRLADANTLPHCSRDYPPVVGLLKDIRAIYESHHARMMKLESVLMDYNGALAAAHEKWAKEAKSATAKA